MVKLPDVYVIGKGREWLQSNGTDMPDIPQKCTWSQYLYNAKRFESRFEAKRKARIIGGAVYRFDPLNGKAEPLKREPPKGAICDNCRGYIHFDGTCRNPESEYYRVNVSYRDVCEEWEAEHERA